jgi:hypothetical protein
MSDAVRLTAPMAVSAAMAAAVEVGYWLIGSIPPGYATAALAKRLW